MGRKRPKCGYTMVPIGETQIDYISAPEMLFRAIIQIRGLILLEG